MQTFIFFYSSTQLPTVQKKGTKKKKRSLFDQVMKQLELLDQRKFEDEDIQVGLENLWKIWIICKSMKSIRWSLFGLVVAIAVF